MKDEPVFEYHAEEAAVEIELPDSTKRLITIKSGWSFGTGGHETTRLCLKALEELFRNKTINSVLDLGCGSGILSIASSLLGAGDVTGLDIDSSITDEARTNALGNNLKGQVHFSTEPITKIDRKFELLIANILFQTIESLLPDISEKVNIDGFFLASGIRVKEKDSAVNLIEKSGFKFFVEHSENEWAAMVFEKNA